MKKYLSIMAVLAISTYSFAQSCELDGYLHANFEDVKSILTDNNCSSCHNSVDKKSGWSFETYDAFLKNGDCQKKMVVHGDAANSYFYNRLSGSIDICGEAADNIHSIGKEDIDLIETWINFGAPEYCMPFYQDVKFVLNNNGCQNCHVSNPQAWRYDTYQNMLSNGLDGNCSAVSNIIKGNSSQSLLYDKINNDGKVVCGAEMNNGNSPMSYEDVAMIRDWINGGAIESAATLPVLLSVFRAEANGMTTILNWTTEAEIATDKFIIERSQTGRNFQQIASVPSKGSSNVTTNYSFIDELPLFGENYYRLRIVDLDESFDYSSIRLATIKTGETELKVYPNPAMGQERLTVRWIPKTNQETTYLNIVDVNGQNLHRKIIFEGTNYVRLPNLLDGVYYIIVENLFEGFLLERVVIIN